MFNSSGHQSHNPNSYIKFTSRRIFTIESLSTTVNWSNEIWLQSPNWSSNFCRETKYLSEQLYFYHKIFEHVKSLDNGFSYRWANFLFVEETFWGRLFHYSLQPTKFLRIFDMKYLFPYFVHIHATQGVEISYS
jgi:hypothetical protein